MEKYATLESVAKKVELQNLTPEISLENIKVTRRNINRPAFQLTGFYEYYDNQRIQILGRAEYEYIKHLTEEEKQERFDKLFSMGCPGIVLCRGLEVEQVLLETAKKHGIPVLWTEKTTGLAMSEIMNYMNRVLALTDTIHGVCVNVHGEGILITGDSGIGKSEAAVELVKRGHLFVADDVVEIRRINENIVIGEPTELTKNFAELRGLGVVDIKSLYGVESVMEFTAIDMIIHLEEWDGRNSYDRLGLTEEYQELLGVKVIKHTLPIRPGRNLSILIETAAVNNRQKKMGYNAAQALCERVTREIHSHETETNVEKEQKEYESRIIQ